MTIDGIAELEPVTRLSRDLVQAIKTGKLKMTRGDIRYLVDAYYQLQEYRKAAFNQEGAASDSAEPASLVEWLAGNMKSLEGQVKRALDAWTETDAASVWAKSITGIGPVISAGLAAHIDIERAPTVGHIWSFAGLNPTVVWNKGEKRPWNARLKTLCWKIGDSFVKFHNHPKCSYGKLYVERKLREVARNERGDFLETAKRTLGEKKIRELKTREVYEAGQLPPGRIDLMARRWVVKLFLSHWHDAAYQAHYGKEPPKPYVLTNVPGHAHEIRRGDMT